MDAPAWISKRVAWATHDEQLAEHGGAAGLRAEGGLDSALHRPMHLFTYGHPDMPGLAASYAFGLAKNHPFVDGNKRTSFVVCLTFLAINGIGLEATDEDKVTTWLKLAEGSIDEAGIAGWIRDRVSS